jgi:hypothetical protein
VANKPNELLWLRRLKMFFLDPKFTIKMIWIGEVIKLVIRKQVNVQKWVDYLTKVVPDRKPTPISKPIVEIVEADMFMCVAINPKNMMELHGIIAHNEPELVANVQDIGTRTRIMYVGNVADIKRAIIHDYEVREQNKFIRRKMEKAKWN